MERVLALLPDPFTRKDYEQLMRASACMSSKFVRAMERWGLVRAKRDGTGVV
jgi:hypothetical protein